MPYNLLRERWIPIRRLSGASDWIAPHQITESDDPPVAIASPRPDFDGALTQFLIGLMQTANAPEDSRHWRRNYENPPSVEELQEKFATLEAAFNLDGEGPRFMQDLTLDSAQAETVPIGALLIDRMGEVGLEDKADLFAKPHRFPGLGLDATAIAVLTLQLNAPGGGRGHRTSIRGGGPLSTVIQGETLFRTVWLNTLIGAVFLAGFGRQDLSGLESTFPWMAPTRISEAGAGGRSTTPDDIHPAQQYWGMPRRIRLLFADQTTGRCAVFGTEGVPLVTEYLTRHSGINYEGDFRHPLTPYSVVKPSEPLNPKKAKADGIPYRDWPQFITGDDSHQPARVVQAFYAERRFATAAQVRLWAFGYEMDNMKPRAWHHAVSLLVPLEPEVAAAFRTVLDGLVEASESVRTTVIQKVKEAIARRPKDLPGDIAAVLNAAFWSRTEAAFFETVVAVRSALSEGLPQPEDLERWLSTLHRAATEIFDAHSQIEGELSAADVRRVAVASNALHRFTFPNSRALREAVGLAVPETKPKTKRAKRSKKEVLGET